MNIANRLKSLDWPNLDWHNDGDTIQPLNTRWSQLLFFYDADRTTIQFDMKFTMERIPHRWQKQHPTTVWFFTLLISMCPAIPIFANETWVEFEGDAEPGQGKHIVFVTGDDEYRSEEGMPMLAKILSVRHGFRCTVLFPIHPEDGTITPNFQNNIPGTQKLNDADLMVLFTRFRELPDDQMKPIIDFSNSGKPMIGLRTSTHAFHYQKNKNSVYAKYTWNSQNPPGGFWQASLWRHLGKSPWKTWFAKHTRRD